MATDYPELTRARLRQVLDSYLRPAIFSDRAPLEVRARLLPGEPVPAPEALRGEFKPIEAGAPWGPPWSTTWFHVRGRVPPAWAGRTAVALVDLGYTGQTGFTCEALAWRDGRPWRGVDPNHRWLPLDGPAVDFHLEAAANPMSSIGGPGAAASAIAQRTSGKPLFRLGRIEVAVLEEEVRALHLDFKVLLELALALPAGDPRGPEFLAALNRAANRLDLEDLAGTAAAARTELAPALARHGAAENHKVTAAGHAHLDTAWLWPVRETVRKAARSFSTQLALMDEYAEHHFACSQPVQYEWMRDGYPDLYEAIRRRVAEGRWEPVGPMWTEADCNLPSGESLVRQVLHGQRFWRRELGLQATVAWLPDVFGYPASLPQIFAGAGCTRFLTQKLSWNQFNLLPHHTFWWEGLDGTRVLTHFPPGDTYNGSFEVGQLVDGVRRFKDQGRSDRSLYLFGWGDGGGGPEPDMLESARRVADLDGAPRVEVGRVDGFFAAVERDAESLATWAGELYFELHRGTYTTQARLKALNRRAEQALRAAELWAAAAGGDYPRADLDRAWRTVLLNQFHDILPGSSIDWVYEVAERELAEVVETARAASGAAARRLLGEGGEPAVLNVNSHPRREVLEDADGRCFWAEAPACGHAPLAAARGVEDVVEASERILENGLLRIRWDEQGRLVSVYDKEVGRETLAAGALGNVLRLHHDHPALWDAWDLDPAYQEAWAEVEGVRDIEVVRPGGLRGAVDVTRTFGDSTLTQRLVLDAGSRLLRFETTVDWRERHRVLRAVFPVAVQSPRATYEIQFGHVERPTHRNTSWDVARYEACAHRWVDLGDAGYGVALLNDSKYGHDVRGGEVGITLLRGSTHPDPGADLGEHRFTYALLPHPGDFRQAGVIQAAHDLNSPLELLAAAPAPARSLLSVDSPQVVVEAVKLAEDSNAVVVRLYEAWGGWCRTTLRTDLGARRATLTDLLENELGDLPLDGGAVEIELAPFKIATVKLER